MHINLELDDRVTARDEPVVSVRQDDGLVRLGTHDDISGGGSTCRGLVNKIIGRRRAGASDDHGRGRIVRRFLETQTVNGIVHPLLHVAIRRLFEVQLPTRGEEVSARLRNMPISRTLVNRLVRRIRLAWPAY